MVPIKARFDGKVLIPLERLDCKAGETLDLLVLGPLAPCEAGDGGRRPLAEWIRHWAESAPPAPADVDVSRAAIYEPRC